MAEDLEQQPATEDPRQIERRFVTRVNQFLGELKGPVIVFGISLKARSTPEKWAIVEANLRATLACLEKQTDQNFIVAIAGHDKPKLGRFKRSICWLQADWEPPTAPSQYSNDKQKKRRLILSQLRRTKLDGFYFFTADADDFLHPDLCKHIRADHNRAGYYIDKGYVYDASAGVLGTLSPETQPFHRLCGTCAAFWVTPADLPQSYQDKTTIWSRLLDHTHFPETMAELGRPIAAVPFSAGLYFLNHGASNVQEKGTNRHKTASAVRWRIRSLGKAKSILRQFSVRGAVLRPVEPAPAPAPTATPATEAVPG